MKKIIITGFICLASVFMNPAEANTSLTSTSLSNDYPGCGWHFCKPPLATEPSALLKS